MIKVYNYFATLTRPTTIVNGVKKRNERQYRIPLEAKWDTLGRNTVNRRTKKTKNKTRDYGREKVRITNVSVRLDDIWTNVCLECYYDSYVFRDAPKERKQ